MIEKTTSHIFHKNQINRYLMILKLSMGRILNHIVYVIKYISTQHNNSIKNTKNTETRYEKENN